MRAARARVAGCLLLAVAASAGAAGCTSRVADKTGGTGPVLRFAIIDRLDANTQNVSPAAFVTAVARLSGGRLRVDVVDRYGDGAAAAETDMVTAMAAGSLDGGFPATRAFSRAGLRGLEPLEAPLTLTSHAAEKALAGGPGGQRLLATLDGSGVVALGLAVGPLRRAWSAAGVSLADVRAWRGLPTRVYNSPVQADTVRALGGVPVEASFEFPQLVRAGRLAAVELDVAQYALNGYGRLLPALTADVVLWPRMTVIAMSRRRFDALTDEQRGWLQAAGREAVQASIDLGYDDGPIAGRLCQEGVRVAEASPEQLALLRRAVRPVVDRLAADPVTAPSLREVQAAAASAPAVPEPLAVPATCRLSR